ncbi:hypothetical protein [uncultured Jatrophihabitans sp.]|uniref:hypothetical protein n=1 Tax=uncultured Jatrophihabitans sp. TaxID=1610747 RepID=UPI0035C9ACB2
MASPHDLARVLDVRDLAVRDLAVRDLDALRQLLADDPSLAVEKLRGLPHRHGRLAPLSYLADAPLDLAGGGWRELPRGADPQRASSGPPSSA